MLTKFYNYINESLNIDSIENIIFDINKTLKSTHRFTVEYNITNKFLIRNYIIKIIISEDEDYIYCLVYGSNWTKLKINNNDNQINNKITDYIIKYYIITEIRLFMNIDIISSYIQDNDLFPSENKTIYNMIDFMLIDNNINIRKIFIDKLLLLNRLPLNIHNHYLYLIQAKNFDLI